MNRIVSAGHTALFLVLLLSPNKNSEAFIQFPNTPTNQSSIVVAHSIAFQSHSSELLQSLERITCLSLEVRDQYLRVKESKLPILYASIAGKYLVERAIHADRRCSSTARDLLLGAIRSSSVYKVRGNRDAALGRVAANDFIELDFSDLGEITYRDLPREVFDIGMIFLHELAHRHLKLSDPSKKEIEMNSLVKGETVLYINRIEHELGLPQRRHYAPIKIRHTRSKPQWGIYYGTSTDRIELDPRFGLR